MATLSNNTGVPLYIAAVLASDDYDYVANTISTTALMKPTRQLVLSSRVSPEDRDIDVLDVVKSRIGTAIHDSVEKVWLTDRYKRAMAGLGYSEDDIKRIRVNPEKGTLKPGEVPLYVEQRMFRDFMGRTLTGKFDAVAEGRVNDVKSTSVFTAIYGGKDEDYQLQGSIYRWLDQGERIHDDFIAVQWIFTDWQATKAKLDKNYPPQPTQQKLIPLLSLEDTEAYIAHKLNELTKHESSPEHALPRCTDKELWRKPATYKYYKDGNVNAARSTKNFDNPLDAYNRMQKDGGRGAVKEVPGEVIACRYCPARNICTQKDEYLAEGSLVL